MAQSGFTPIKLYLSTTAAAVPTAANLAPGELAINNNDGKLFYEDSSGVVQVIATKAGASGDVVGPASATDNAVARYDGTTGKIIQNSVVTIADDGATVIDVNSTSAGLRITQLGAGNALVVEDSANPDATPTVITADGTVILGNTTSVPVWGFANALQVWGGFGYTSQGRFSNDAFSAFQTFVKSRSTTPGGFTVVQSGDEIGRVAFAGADGAAYIAAADIRAAVDGTPGTNDMPGRLVFSTTADGASSPTERMRIDQAGRVGIGGTPSVQNRLRLAGTATGNTTQFGFLNELATASDVTGSSTGFTTSLSTAAAAFTLSELRHFSASFTTVGAGSTITSQSGFYASAALTGATNNYGFHSAIASGTGRWNFYAAGTASNYFEGSMFIGGVLGGDTKFAISGTAPSAGGGSYANRTSVTFPSAATAGAVGFDTSLSTTAAAYTLSNLFHYNASQSTIGAGSAVTNQYGFTVQPTLIGATNNYGFYGNIASGTGRWNFYAAGTADNYFAGRVGVGLAASAGIKTRIANDRAVDAFALSLDTYNGASFENSLIAGFNGTNAFFGNFQNFPLNVITNNVTRQVIAANGTISLGAAPGSESLRVTPVAGAVNYWESLGASTGISPVFQAAGSDTNVSAVFATKGTGGHLFRTNGNTANTQFLVAHTASAVDYIQATGSSAGFPNFSAAGSSTNITIVYGSKGTGGHNFTTNGTSTNQFVVAHTASAVNYLQVTGNATTGAPILSAQGSDANVGMILTSKGTFGLALYTNGGAQQQFSVAHTASAVNYLQVTGSASTTPTLSAQGSGADVDIALTPKGTGNVRFGTYTAGIIAQAGYITIKDAGGTTRRLLVG